MFNFNNLSIRAKLLISFGTILLIAMIVSSIAIRSLLTGTSIADTLVFSIDVEYKEANNVNKATNIVVSDIINYLTPGQQTDANLNKVKNSLTDLKRFVAIEKDEAKDDADDLKKVIKIESYVQTLEQKFNEDIEDLLLSHKPYEALEIFLLDYMPVKNELINDIDMLISHHMDHLTNIAKELQSDTNTYIVSALALAQLVISLLVAILLSNYIANNLKKNCRVANAIANGDFTVDIPTIHHDELGELNDSLRQMRDTLKDTINTVVDFASTVKKIC